MLIMMYHMPMHACQYHLTNCVANHDQWKDPLRT